MEITEAEQNQFDQFYLVIYAISKFFMKFRSTKRFKCLARALYHYGNDKIFKSETDKLIADLDVSFADDLKLVMENYKFFDLDT